MKYSDILTLDIHQLKEKLVELRKQLAELQLKKSISPGAVKDTSVFKKLRKGIARIGLRLSTYHQ